MNIEHTLTETITVKPPAGVGTHGDPQFGSAFALPARVQLGRDRKSEHIEHDAVVYTTIEITINSRVWLPGDPTSDDSLARRAKYTYRTKSLDGSFTLFKTLLGR